MHSAPIESLRASNADAASQRLEHMYSRLELTGWNADLFLMLLGSINGQLPDSSHATQVRWVMQLQNVYNPLCTHVPERDLAFELGCLCASMLHWAAACDFFRLSLERSGSHHATHYNLGMAAWQLSQHHKAQHFLALAVNEQPQRERYCVQLEALNVWRKKCQDLPESAPRNLTEKISATLMGPHHAHALWQRQSDPQVLRLTRLPHHSSSQEARRWIVEQAAIPGKTSFAVIHADYGLMGGFALQRQGNKAFFYYWIGRDFQNMGHGRITLDLLREMAVRHDIDILYSAVFENNARSLNALRGAGYCCLPGAWQAGTERIRFYYRALSDNAQDIAENALLNDLDALQAAAGGPLIESRQP